MTTSTQTPNYDVKDLALAKAGRTAHRMGRTRNAGASPDTRALRTRATACRKEDGRLLPHHHRNREPRARLEGGRSRRSFDRFESAVDSG